jgi:tetracycline 7-halogenase / FADH2 O2-dependent halogenase
LWRRLLSDSFDIAVVGSGFAGSLLAMIAHRLGRSVLLLERGKHPRVVIGESSTPLSNLLLEELATRYDLPRVAPLAKWGTWHRAYPNLPCGLKRGFTFYHHVLGQAAQRDPERREQLLVAASPHDGIADTHWYRAGFDEFLVREAQELGVEYVDDVKLDRISTSSEGHRLSGRKNGSDVVFRAKLVVDATGPRGFLHHALQLGECEFPNFPRTQALYSHFSGVQRLEEAASDPAAEQPPYPIEDAAVHHVFEGGWIWVLRFSNGITSAGAAVTDDTAQRLRLEDGAPAWDRLLQQLPAVEQQFRTARVERAFTHIPRLSFLSTQIAGQNCDQGREGHWALLPSAAGFVDPLLSTGFPLTLLGIARLAEIIERHWGSPEISAGLEEYAAQTKAELLAASRLIGGLYASMGNFAVFTSLSLLYFAAASFSETARRLGRPQLAQSFLLHDHAVFGPSCRQLCERARHIRTAAESDEFTADVVRTIEPFNVAGLGNPARRNWYPVDPEDLLQSADKVSANRGEILRLLERCGFKP